MIKIALIFVSLYAIFVGVLFVGQRGMIYHPSTFVPAEDELRSRGLTFWPEETNYRGFTTMKNPVETRGVIVMFHGNASLAHDRVDLALSLADAGFRVVMAEYPGYGGREGVATERMLIEDATKTVRLVEQEFGLPVYLWGESLGSGVAAGAAAALTVEHRHTTISALVLQVPFDSMANIAQHHYWYLPARWLLKDKYDSADYLKNYHGKVAVLVAENDRVIPSEYGVSLFSSLNTRKKLWTVSGAEHFFPADASAPWWQEVLNFIESSCDEIEQDC